MGESQTNHDRPGAWVRAYLGLGSNLGDREAFMRRALDALGSTPGIRLLRCTPFRHSEPWGDPDQLPYLNAVAEIETTLNPEALLMAAKEIEQDLGRRPSRRWGPREIDIDLLTWGSRRLRTPSLVLPHPHLLDRPFVFEPLAKLNPALVEELRADAAIPV